MPDMCVATVAASNARPAGRFRSRAHGSGAPFAERGRSRLVALLVAVVVPVGVAVAIVPATASADSCPNAAVRAQQGTASLPDCRAWEMVTPPDKGGFDVVNVPVFKPAGGALVFNTPGAINGATSANGVGNPYLAQRTASGWKSTFIGASDSQNAEGAGLSDFTPDLSTAIATLNAPGLNQRSEYYLRTPTGEFDEIGPAHPGAQSMGDNAYFGASQDLSHIVFESFDNFFPGDPTSPGHTSLYEYIGTGNTAPILVDVDSNGNPISSCGAVLGSPSGSLFHAVSADGSTVFFTPGTGTASSGCLTVSELFARIDGGEPDARTVSLSEPSLTDCGACDTSSPASATFQGASADGSKAFFTTTQPLLSGATGENIYEYNFDAAAGQKLQLVSGGDATVTDPASDVLGVTRISGDGSHVYFVAGGVLTTTPNSQGAQASAGADNLYLYEQDAAFPNGRTVFIGDLAAADSSLWGPQAGPVPAEATPDGRFLVFATSAPLTPDDTDTAQDVYEYDATANTLTRISIGSNGSGNDSAFSASIANVFTTAYTDFSDSASAGNSVSDDGQYVFFTTNEPLVPSDTNGAADVYEYHDGQVSLISDGTTSTGSTFVGSTASGQDVYFSTRGALVSQDTDGGNLDVYDARINGGFLVNPPPSPCADGDACQGAATGAPPPAAAGTVTFTGPGDRQAAPSQPPAPAPQPTQKPPVTTGKVKVSGKTVRGARFGLRVKIPGKGRVTITGASVTKVSKSFAKAGTKQLTVRLTKRARFELKHKRRMKIRVKVAYKPAAGKSSSVFVRFTVKA